MICYLSIPFGKKRIRIDKIKGDYRDEVGAIATVFTIYPSWFFWIHSTEEVYRSKHGFVWSGQVSGEAHPLGLNHALNKIYDFAANSDKFIRPTCHVCNKKINEEL
jgi:hypothetical protein